MTENNNIEQLETTRSNPWDNAPTDVYFYNKIYEDGRIGSFTQSAKLAYELGLDIEHDYIAISDVQQSDINGDYFVKDKCPMKSETDIQKDAYREEITTLKKQLSATDYKAIKYAEGVLTDEEYQETGIQRQVWRARINELEELIGD